MKYILIGSGTEFKKNQLVDLYQRYRYLISNAYSYQSTLQVSGETLLNGLDEEKND